MPRKPHPSDLFNAQVIAKAVEWSAFTRAGGRLVQHFGSRSEAKEAAGQMADHFQRPALVYAIDGNGRSAVADMIHPKISQQKESIVTKITTKFAKRFNAQRAARNALGIEAQEGVAFRTFKVEGGFAWEAIALEPKRGRKTTQVTQTAPHGKRAAIEEVAREGCLPTPPDFSAATHARLRAKLAKPRTMPRMCAALAFSEAIFPIALKL